MSLELIKVSHAFGSQCVLKEVTLTVNDGETVAIRGASGSGKSTLLSILGGALRPTSGRAVVHVDGTQRDPRSTAEAFGWVFQTTNAWSRRTVVDNAATGLLALGEPYTVARRTATVMLQRVGILSKATMAANTLSGGELQRLCIARALAPKPRYLLAVEPTGQLDQSTSLEILDVLFDASDQVNALVVATHDPLVSERCDRQLQLVDGELVEDS
jgi:ABC-type lipoprotein export system ATPase subunit